MSSYYAPNKTYIHFSQPWLRPRPPYSTTSSVQAFRSSADSHGQINGMNPFYIPIQRENGEVHMPKLPLSWSHKSSSSNSEPREASTIPARKPSVRNLKSNRCPQPPSTTPQRITQTGTADLPIPTQSSIFVDTMTPSFDKGTVRCKSKKPKRAQSKIKKKKRSSNCDAVISAIVGQGTFRGPTDFHFDLAHGPVRRVAEESSLADTTGESHIYGRSRRLCSNSVQEVNNDHQATGTGILMCELEGDPQPYPLRDSSWRAHSKNSSTQSPHIDLHMPGERPEVLDQPELPTCLKIAVPHTQTATITRKHSNKGNNSQPHDLVTTNHNLEPPKSSLATSQLPMPTKSPFLVQPPSAPTNLAPPTNNKDPIVPPQELEAIFAPLNTSSFPDPAAIKLYHSYKSTGKITPYFNTTTTATTTSSPPTNDDIWQRCWPLINAYIYGASLGHSHFADGVLNLLTKSIPHGVPAGADTIAYIFTEQQAPDKLKQFVVERCVAAGETFLRDIDVRNLPADFVCRALKTAVLLVQSGAKPYGVDGSRCHVQRSLEECDGFCEGVVGVAREIKAGRARIVEIPPPSKVRLRALERLQRAVVTT